MTEVVETSTTDLLSEQALASTVTSVADVSTVEVVESVSTVTAEGSDIVVVTADATASVIDVSGETTVITDTASDVVYGAETEIQILEVAEQGPAGPAGAEYPGKTLTYTGSLLTEVRSYLDAAKTTLAERRVLAYVGSVLSTIQFFNGSGALQKTRTLTYSGGVLVGVVDV